ncbi:hypothetical protein, partial [Streptomyces filamentosus]|uniref:hypothetical protein n=1 Tax=Streptomyces filamentosus TaxID=67294 RepID=UPI0033D3D2B5
SDMEDYFRAKAALFTPERPTSPRPRTVAAALYRCRRPVCRAPDGEVVPARTAVSFHDAGHAVVDIAAGTRAGGSTVMWLLLEQDPIT